MKKGRRPRDAYFGEHEVGKEGAWDKSNTTNNNVRIGEQNPNTATPTRPGRIPDYKTRSTKDCIQQPKEH